MFKSNGDITVAGRVMFIARDRVQIVERASIVEVLFAGASIYVTTNVGNNLTIALGPKSGIAADRNSLVEPSDGPAIFAEITRERRDSVFEQRDDGTWHRLSNENRSNTHPANRTPQKAIEE